MSKSRSREDKDKDKERDLDKDKEKEVEKEKDDEKEKEEGDEETDENAEFDVVQLSMNQLQLNSDGCDLKSPALDSNSLMVRNETAIPSSPPPSYEHVIEQTRMEHAAEEQKHESQQMSWSEKNSAGDTLGTQHKTAAKGPEIWYKSTTKFYTAMAKQWGITCKMSDDCRCLDCQSRYFDCEYEKNENQKTDGGLSAGTPMFISEVMQSSGCVML